MMTEFEPVQRFHWNTDAYAEAFEILLKCSGERLPVYAKLERLFSNYPANSKVVDWGAGSGDLTALLLQHFNHVYAVEPNAAMCQVISERCPTANVFNASMIDVVPAERFDIGIISHVLYHIPDYKWGAYIMHAARFLTERGVLVVTLKNPDSECNKMLEYFGAASFDLYARLEQVVRRHKAFDFTFSRVPGGIRTHSFEETLAIARFMFCDRDPDAFSTEPKEAEFQRYVREHFWDPQTSTGGWSYDVVFCLIERNPLFIRS
ncbi:MAG: class I SAM-dependent methyltransferase [Gammaproteobacteria bacterium]